MKIAKEMTFLKTERATGLSKGSGEPYDYTSVRLLDDELTPIMINVSKDCIPIANQLKPMDKVNVQFNFNFGRFLKCEVMNIIVVQ